MKIKIERSLAKEIKALNGDGSRDARFETFEKVLTARKELSTTAAPRIFNECLKKHGRGVIAIVVASTLYERRERLEGWRLSWALAVLELWTNKMPRYTEAAAIDDGLHPTKICDYANMFIKLTSED